ncbi:MAG TPA: hypothetical protein VN753_06375 [Terracidiphilus sp.]|nr:hypothetical protein [Terracidiphilus sp.]
MATLDGWLNQAVRRLSKDSADTVRREIQEHYDAAREAALQSGNDLQQADDIALQALGDPCAANRQYRKVLLTSSEAKVLRQSNAESRMLCSSGWIRWVLLSAQGALLLLSAASFAMHLPLLASGVLVLGALMAMFFTVPFFPIYTITRGRIYRAVKWALLTVAVFAFFGKDGWNWLWLGSCCFFPVIYMEWKRAMIRRKLPISRWPKQLYL